MSPQWHEARPASVILFTAAHRPAISKPRAFQIQHFSVTRQLRYSKTRLGWRLTSAFHHGLPIITFELKNSSQADRRGRR